MPSVAQAPLQGPQSMSWVHPIGTRDGSLLKDPKMVNCFYETTELGPMAVKRPGLSLVSGTTGIAQGTFNCGTSSYVIVNDTAVNINTGARIGIPGITSPLQRYYTLSNVPLTPTAYSWVKSASGLWRFDGTTFLKVTDTNYPGVTMPGFTYLDGVYYVMDSTGSVLGSTLEDGTTWPALDFIRPDYSLGAGVAIHRHLNYIVALYENGVQMYYDANAAVNGNGIALGDAGDASWTTGCSSGDSVTEMTDTTFFIANDNARGRVCMSVTGLEMSIVSTPFVEKIFNLSNLQTVYSFGLRVVGHSFYVVSLVDLDITLVYDVAASQWQVWSSLNGSTEGYFHYGFYLKSSYGDVLQDIVTGATIRMDPSSYTDYGSTIRMTSITQQYDFGTMNWKRIAGHYFFGDTSNTTVTISFSDDDYQTWNNPRVVDMSSVRKMIQRNGRWRRRAFKLVHEDNTPLRVGTGMMDLAVLSN